MKSSVDIHVVLSTFEDMEDFHDDPDEASERLNFILHAVYDNAEEDIEKRGTEGVCTGKKFGGPTCRSGTKRYNLAKTFRKMAKKRKKKK